VCRERGVPLHCDAAQAATERIPWAALDLVSLSAHKLHGPMGVGALGVRRTRPPLHLRPLCAGGGHERGLRPGTLPVPLCVGFGVAVDHLDDAGADRVRGLRDTLWAGLSARVEGLVLHGPPLSERAANNLNLSVDGVEAAALLLAVREHLALSTGSACTSETLEPSHVLRALGGGPGGGPPRGPVRPGADDHGGGGGAGAGGAAGGDRPAAVAGHPRGGLSLVPDYCGNTRWNAASDGRPVRGSDEIANTTWSNAPPNGPSISAARYVSAMSRGSLPYDPHPNAASTSRRTPSARNTASWFRTRSRRWGRRSASARPRQRQRARVRRRRRHDRGRHHRRQRARVAAEERDPGERRHHRGVEQRLRRAVRCVERRDRVGTPPPPAAPAEVLLVAAVAAQEAAARLRPVRGDQHAHAIAEARDHRPGGGVVDLHPG
jgi:hypothetical protein